MADVRLQLRRVEAGAAQVKRACVHFLKTMQVARDAGASTRQIGKAAGLSHQRVSQPTKPPDRDLDEPRRKPLVALD
jgi:hypothetical protein